MQKKPGILRIWHPEKLKKVFSADGTDLYDRLSALYVVIDKGEAELNVPMYNGGLFVTFDGASLPEVDETKAEEVRTASSWPPIKSRTKFLAQGLDLLARDIDEKTQALAMIDYKSLGVRQLGSIYEGLLEFRRARRT